MLLLYGLMVGAAAVWALRVSRRGHMFDIGWMSDQWLAQYRSRHPD